MRGEARRRFDGVAGESRNSYKGIPKILTLLLSLSLPSPSLYLSLSQCTTNLACRTSQRAVHDSPSSSRDRQHRRL